MKDVGTLDVILKHKGSSIWFISPDATVYEAISLMAEKNVGALLVMSGENLVGIISERDYTRKVVLKGKASKQTQVREIISSPVHFATPNHSVEECMRIMTAHRVRHLPLMDGKKVVGVISIGDLVNWIISAQSATISQLESYITGGYPS